MQIRAVDKAKDLIKRPDDALDVKRRQMQCTLIHVDVVVFHLNRTSECPPRVNRLGLMQATSMRLLQQPKRLRVDLSYLSLVEKKSSQDSWTSDVAMARPREEEAILFQERFWNLVGSLEDH